MTTVLTLAEAARELKCSKAHLSHLINGKVPRIPVLPSIRIGRRVLIRYEVLIQWIQELEK